MSLMVKLTIDKVEEDQVQGIAWVGWDPCRVDMPVQGRIEGGVLKLWGAP
jgi:hypothetical protein